MLTPAPGLLLVATPDLDDPNFRTTVVLLLQHDEEGSLGVVLNRATDVRLADALATPDDAIAGTWPDQASPPPTLFVGGPVQPNALVALGREPADIGEHAFEQVFDDVGVVSLADGPPAGGLRAFRIFAGYAGWGSGQLGGEIERGSWFVLAAEPSDPFTATPSELWRTVLQRQGGVFSTATDQPDMN